MKFLHRIQQGILAVCLGVLLGWSFAESQAATLRIDSNIYKLNRQGKWEKDGRASLTADILRNHLSNLKDPLTNAPRVGDCFKELGRLILAQDLYVHDNLDNSGPNYINSQRAGGLCQTRTLLDLKKHLFDHGHMGWYPHTQKIDTDDFYAVVGANPRFAPRGIFNVARTIRDRILPGIQGWSQELALPATRNMSDIILRGAPSGKVKGYDVDPQNQQVNADPISTHPNLGGAAVNLITKVFSSDAFENPNFGPVQWGRGWSRFTIEATYNGGPIQGIDYTRPTVSPPPDNCLGLQSNGTPTNRICLVVGVYSGRIYIASLFPIEEA